MMRMHSVFAAVTSLLLAIDSSAASEKIGLGVGASSPNEVIVKVDGRDQHVRLVNVPAGTDASKQFLQCLVAGRIVKNNGGKLTMLDGTSVNEQVSEYLQSRTTADPCTLGKAAYAPHPAASKPESAAAESVDGQAPKEGEAGRKKAPAGKSSQRQKH